jgi:polar amino acid transport system substrate-binding protein
MKSFVGLIWFSIFSLLAASPTLAQEPVAFDSDYKPFMHGEVNAPKGLYPRIVAEAFKRMNVPVTLNAYPWKRALSLAEAGASGVCGIYLTRERQEIYDFSLSLHRETILVYVRKGQEFPFSHIDDLQGKTIGVMRGWSYGDAFDQAVRTGKVRKEETGEDAMNAQKLVLQRVDAFLAAPESMTRLLPKLGLEGVISPLPTPLAVNDAHLAFAKSARKMELLAAFNAALASMRAEGLLDTYATEEFSK